MSCSNCYNGCTEIVSDQCVKYTGVPVPVLGIQTGDSLSYVEQSLIGFLTSTLDGTGIKPTIDPAIICTLVQKYLPTCGDLTAVDLFNALIKAACDLQEQVDAIVADLAALEGSYDIGCLTGVTSSSGTHNILQAVITQLCTLSADFAAFVIDVETNYVKLADLNALIQAYLNSLAPTNQYNTRMVPYTVVEYYGPITGKFDSSGAGIAGAGFDKIYLCNGQNGTPDRRGRVGVGVTYGSGMDPEVNPGGSNPTYNLSTKWGNNAITLDATQIPSHTHTMNPTISDPGHQHFVANPGDTSAILDSTHVMAVSHSTGGNAGYELVNTNGTTATVGLTDLKTTGITITNKDITATGGGQSHSNIQPVIACYYIMYIP